MAAEKNSFDFRIAVRERERAIRLIEAMMSRSAYSGEELDRESLQQLLDTVSGYEPATAGL